MTGLSRNGMLDTAYPESNHELYRSSVFCLLKPKLFRRPKLFTMKVAHSVGCLGSGKEIDSKKIQ